MYILTSFQVRAHPKAGQNTFRNNCCSFILKKKDENLATPHWVDQRLGVDPFKELTPKH